MSRPSGRTRSPLATLAAASASSATQSRRDGGLMLGLFLLPMAIIGIVGLAMQGYSDPVFTVGFLDRAGSPESAALRTALADEPTVRVRDYESRDLMQAAVYRGRLHAGLLLPVDWTRAEDVEMYASAASVGAIVLRAIADARLARVEAPESVRIVPSGMADGGEEGSPPIGFHYTAPSNLVLFLMVSGVLSSTGMLMMRRRGITRRLLATPARTWELILLMIVGPAQTMAVQAVFLVVSTAVAFGVPWGDPVGTVLLTCALVLVGLALALFMSTIFRSPEQAFSLAPLLAICAGMLGGCMWPLSIVPAWLRDAGHALPTAWAMDGYIDLIFGRADAAQVMPNVAVLLAMALVLGTIGTLRLRGRLAG